MKELPKRVHIIGIGGIGLSAIARILLARGVAVSGSDMSASIITGQLSREGAQIFIGHRAENVGEVDYVLVTSAAREDNPEVLEARRRGIRVGERYDFFPTLTAGKKTIAVAGTHGKTTTTAMIALMLTNAGFDPTVIIGGTVLEWNSNARVGNGEYFVIEADEYERAFLGLRPAVAIVTSIEMDHPDIFRDGEDVARAFRDFMRLVPSGGALIACGDSEQVTREARGLGARTALYGFSGANDWRAADVRPNSIGGSDFNVWHGGVRVGEIELQVPGKHNVLNALAALAVGDQVGANFSAARETLRAFRGVARRFEVKGEFGGVTIIDDYAHHPTEIRATLAAARERYRGKAIWAVFQPHTFSRTRALLNEFAGAFADADHVIVTEIYAAREQADASVNSQMLVEKMNHADARYIAEIDQAARKVTAGINSGDVLITLGAGDVFHVGEQVRDARRAQARR